MSMVDRSKTYTYLVEDEDGVMVEQEVDVDEWNAYMPTVLAVVETGALDSWIYKLARVAKRRHHVSRGEAVPSELDEELYNNDPSEELEESGPEPISVDDARKMGLLLENNKMSVNVVRPIQPVTGVKEPVFTYLDRRYYNRNVEGRYVVLSASVGSRYHKLTGYLVKVISVKPNGKFRAQVVSSGSYFGKIYPSLELAAIDHVLVG